MPANTANKCLLTKGARCVKARRLAFVGRTHVDRCASVCCRRPRCPRRTTMNRANSASCSKHDPLAGCHLLCPRG
eukprot:4751172-Prymnesium_polylepis.1